MINFIPKQCPICLSSLFEAFYCEIRCSGHYRIYYMKKFGYFERFLIGKFRIMNYYDKQPICVIYYEEEEICKLKTSFVYSEESFEAIKVLI